MLGGEVVTLLGVNVGPLPVPKLGVIKFSCDSYFMVGFVSYMQVVHSFIGYQQWIDFGLCLGQIKYCLSCGVCATRWSFAFGFQLIYCPVKGVCHQNIVHLGVWSQQCGCCGAGACGDRSWSHFPTVWVWSAFGGVCCSASPEKVWVVWSSNLGQGRMSLWKQKQESCFLGTVKIRNKTSRKVSEKVSGNTLRLC